jgi:hypothetical protein
MGNGRKISHFGFHVFVLLTSGEKNGENLSNLDVL